MERSPKRRRFMGSSRTKRLPLKDSYPWSLISRIFFRNVRRPANAVPATGQLILLLPYLPPGTIYSIHAGALHFLQRGADDQSHQPHLAPISHMDDYWYFSFTWFWLCFLHCFSVILEVCFLPVQKQSIYLALFGFSLRSGCVLWLRDAAQQGEQGHGLQLDGGLWERPRQRRPHARWQHPSAPGGRHRQSRPTSSWHSHHSHDLIGSHSNSTTSPRWALKFIFIIIFLSLMCVFRPLPPVWLLRLVFSSRLIPLNLAFLEISHFCVSFFKTFVPTL